MRTFGIVLRDPRRPIRIAGHDDLDRSFVDDDHEHDLGGSSIDAKRLRTSTLSKRLAAFSLATTASTVDASNAIPTRTSASRRTSSSGVAVFALDLDGGDGFRGLWQDRSRQQEHQQGRPHDYLMPTLLVTSGVR
jgi:hypothetical protein